MTADREAAIRELRETLQLVEGYLSLIFYRAEVNWGHMGVPERTSVSGAITEARAVLAKGEP